MLAGHQHTTPFDTGILPVGSIHKLHYDQYGKPDGKPVIFLHGGPGGSTSIASTVYFDPTIYRVVLLDQRGAGKSTPLAELRENTSQHLVADIEALREHLAIRKWHMAFGGSWGSTLALLYAQAHPNAVASLVLRGVSTGRKCESDFINSPHGAAMLYPEEYERMMNLIPQEDQDCPTRGYLKLLRSGDAKARHEMMKIWNIWGLCITKVARPWEEFEALDDNDGKDDDAALAHAVLECHYASNKVFVEEGELLRKGNTDNIKHIPCSIVQGRLDLVCPPRTAWDLHRLLPDSKLYMIPAAGHSAKEPGIHKKLVEVCNEYGKLDLI